jgi:hypothetical protein
MTKPSLDNDRLGLAAIESGRLTVDVGTGMIWKRNGLRAEQPQPDAYGRVIVQSHPCRWVFAHRLIWLAAHGPIPAGLEVNHRNRRRWDNRLANLELTDDTGQVRHARGCGYMAVGDGEDQVAVARMRELEAGDRPIRPAGTINPYAQRHIR